MPYRVIILPVGPVIDHTVTNGRDHIIGVPWAVHIIPVIDIDETRIVRIAVIPVVVDVQSADPTYAAETVITYIDIARLDDPAVIVIVNRGVLDLDHCSIIVILDIRIIVVTRIKTDAHITEIGMSSKIWTIAIDVKVELTVGEYGKLDAALHKNE